MMGEKIGEGNFVSFALMRTVSVTPDKVSNCFSTFISGCNAQVNVWYNWWFWPSQATASMQEHMHLLLIRS